MPVDVQDIPIGSVAVIYMGGKRVLGEVTELRTDRVRLSFLPPAQLGDTPYPSLWVTRQDIKEIVKPKGADVPVQPAPPITVEKTIPAISEPAPGERTMRPCKKCGEWVDITGLSGRGIGAAMTRHSRMACPAVTRKPRVHKETVKRQEHKTVEKEMTGAALTPSQVDLGAVLKALKQEMDAAGLRFRLEITNIA